MKIMFSWVINQKNKKPVGGSSNSLGIDQVFTIVEKIYKGAGSFRMILTDACEIGPQSLDIQADGGAMLVSLGEITEDDYEVRSYTNMDSDLESRVEILGDFWDESLVCRDLDIVRGLVEEFYRTGNVSKDILR